MRPTFPIVAVALVVLAAPALAGQEGYPAERSALVLSSRTMLDRGSNGEVQFSGEYHTVLIVAAVPAERGAERPVESTASLLASTRRQAPSLIAAQRRPHS